MAIQLTPEPSGPKKTELTRQNVVPIAKNFEKADETREFPLGKVDILNFNGAVVGRSTLQPGWIWSQSVGPIAKTPQCEATHFQYHVSGTLRIKMKDGTEVDCKPGDVSTVPPGHDSWVVGDEPVVTIDFKGLEHFAKQPHSH